MCSSTSSFLRTERLLPLQFHLHRGHPDLCRRLRSHNVLQSFLSVAPPPDNHLSSQPGSEESLQRSPSTSQSCERPTAKRPESPREERRPGPEGAPILTLNLGGSDLQPGSPSHQGPGASSGAVFTDNKTFPRTRHSS